MVIIQAFFGTEMDCLGRDWPEGDVIGLCDKTLLATSSIFVTKNFVGNKLNMCNMKHKNQPKSFQYGLKALPLLAAKNFG